MRSIRGLVVSMLACLALSGCAVSTHNPQDPFENFNRKMFDFNDKLDETALKPTAEFYQKVTPSFVRTGVGNFFGNIGDIWTGINNLLQGKAREGLSDMMRVVVNTTAGVGGLVDVASGGAQLPKHHEDFGQTLGRWGITPGPYVVLPIWGPMTFRDAVALPVDWAGDPWFYVMPVDVRNSGVVLRLVDERASLLSASDLLEAAALDRYEFVRDSYLQRREALVFDNGDIPRKRKKDDAKDGDAKDGDTNGDVKENPGPADKQ